MSAKPETDISAYNGCRYKTLFGNTGKRKGSGALLLLMPCSILKAQESGLANLSALNLRTSNLSAAAGVTMRITAAVAPQEGSAEYCQVNGGKLRGCFF